MPKKFKGENSKAAEARARKDAQKVAAEEKKKKEAEDAYWADDDKHVLRKQQRKEDREKRHQDVIKRKQENQKLLDEEMSGIRSAKPVPASNKLTRAQIDQNKATMLAEAAAARKVEEATVNELPIEENLNRLEIEGEARDVDAAISVLSKQNEKAVDMHPEKRVKAAYAAFEERRLPEVKMDNPNLRLSQLKQILKKEWQKSAENPLNQR